MEVEGTSSDFLSRICLNLVRGKGVWAHLNNALLAQNAVWCLSIATPVCADSGCNGGVAD